MAWGPIGSAGFGRLRGGVDSLRARPPGKAFAIPSDSAGRLHPPNVRPGAHLQHNRRTATTKASPKLRPPHTPRASDC